jgi:hypothetical protein
MPDAGWADIAADVAPRPGASFAELFSWTLDLCESSDLLSERDLAEIREAAAAHLARITGDETGKLVGTLAYLFAIAHRRAPASRKALGANVRREGRYRVATGFLRIVS